MSWNIGENRYPQQAVLWEIEDKGTYAVGKLGTSRKDKRTGEYANSNWGFVRFVASAYPSILDVLPKTRIIIKSGTISLEPYMKEGVKTWPKNPSIVIFAWENVEPRDNDDTDSPPQIEDSTEEEYPF
jgi:hypothetical protein